MLRNRFGILRLLYYYINVFLQLNLLYMEHCFLTNPHIYVCVGFFPFSFNVLGMTLNYFH